jgi:hypothetical protein
MYQQDYDERLPDRRDLKLTLGYRKGRIRQHVDAGWPPSDPRGGWAMPVLDPYIKNGQIWSCPSVAARSWERPASRPTRRRRLGRLHVPLLAVAL